MIRVLRLMEYTYSDNETAEEDMARWVVPPIGMKLFGERKTVRSTVLTNLQFETEDIVLGRCMHGVDLDKTFCEHGCRV